MNLTDYAALVEPRVGTTQTRWIHFSSACRPFGMVSLSPDTRINGDWGCGYVWGDTQIVGFSHVHDWQIGALLVMPVIGDVDSRGGPDAFASAFSHDQEIVKPGDHRVHLQRYDIAAELTASLRVGCHRYTFPKDEDAAILLDLASTLGPSHMGEGSLHRLDARRLEGRVVNLETGRRPKPLTVYFALELNHDAILESFQGDMARGEISLIEGEGIQARLRLGQTRRPVEMKVALSYTSCAAAWQNLRAETTGRDFEIIRCEARDEWNAWLSRTEVEGGTDEQRARFYTDLFFALAGRRTFSDQAGTYVDNTGDAPVIRQIPLDESGQPRYRHFNSDSFWGAQWSIAPLWSLAYPDVVAQFCHCFMDYYRNGGLIPRGPAGGNYTFVMTSAQTTPLFVSAILQGIFQPDDLEEVYAALRKNHFPGGLMSKCGYEHTSCVGGGLEDYMNLGYIPEDLPSVGMHTNGAAQTLEHAYNDWCLSQLAQTLGKTDDAQLFAARAQNYRNLFDGKIGFMRPRSRDGSWMEPHDPFSKRGWTEAGGWSYTFYVPHDVPGLIECFGSEVGFFAHLEEAMRLSEDTGFKAPHDQHHLTSFDFGNEPAIFVAHQIHVAGVPERTDYWMRRIFGALKGGNTPRDGFGGDEDQGMMGAWNALVAIGLFSVDGACGVAPTYQLTAPFFDRITFHRDARYGPGGSFVIEIQGNAPGAMRYLHSAELDGQPLTELNLTHAQFNSHSRLALRLGPEPVAVSS
jgi:predicted alpha-1,2-mannosidase